MTVLIRLSAGLIAWAAGFCLIYALHGLGCAYDWPARTIAGVGLHRLALVAAWFATVTATGAIAWWSFAHRGDPLGRAAAYANAAAALAAAITFVSILVTPQCL